MNSIFWPDIEFYPINLHSLPADDLVDNDDSNIIEDNFDSVNEGD